MAVEDEVLLEFQGEDSSLSKTAQSVLNDINQLDISPKTYKKAQQTSCCAFGLCVNLSSAAKRS